MNTAKRTPVTTSTDLCSLKWFPKNYWSLTFWKRIKKKSKKVDEEHTCTLSNKISHNNGKKIVFVNGPKTWQGPWSSVVNRWWHSRLTGSRWDANVFLYFWKQVRTESEWWGSREDLGRRATILGNHCWQISLWLSNAYLAESLPSMVENLIGKTGYHSSIKWIH